MKSEGKVACTTEIIAGSLKSFDDAMRVGFRRAFKTLRAITGFDVKEQRAYVDDGEIVDYCVMLEAVFVAEN